MTTPSAPRAVCDDVRLLASADPDAIDSTAAARKMERVAPYTFAVPGRTVDDAAVRVGFPARRDFVGADGTQWCVHERDAKGMTHAHGERCLVFETGNVLRVVWHYPRDWRSLDDAGLEALSKSR